MPFTYEFPAHYVSVDTVIFGADVKTDTSSLRVLLIERGDPDGPFWGTWALPGGFVEQGESLDAAATRELEEETGMTGAYLEQLYTFGEPQRDPRGRVITVAYFALLNLQKCKPVEGKSDAADARWFDVCDLPPLAFDHELIVAKALARLRAKVRYEPIGFNLMPEKFTIGQLRSLYEAILDRPIDGPNFRRSILRMKVLKTAGKERDTSHRPAQLFRFDEERYAQLVRRGFNFEI